jgi:hypothetical protein
MAKPFAFQKPAIPAEKPEFQLEHRYPIAGGEVVVCFARFGAGRLPNAFIISEPEDASHARTRIRDQVALLNELRDWGNPRLLIASCIRSSWLRRP